VLAVAVAFHIKFTLDSSNIFRLVLVMSGFGLFGSHGHSFDLIQDDSLLDGLVLLLGLLLLFLLLFRLTRCCVSLIQNILRFELLRLSNNFFSLYAFIFLCLCGLNLRCEKIEVNRLETCNGLLNQGS